MSHSGHDTSFGDATLRADLAAMERRTQEAEADAKAQAANFEAANRRLDVAASQAYDLVKELQAAESALAVLRGEVVVLRSAIKLSLDHFGHAMEGMGEDVLTEALTATPTAAALGALVQSALTWHQQGRHVSATVEEQLDNVAKLVLLEEDLATKCEAVLAAMGKDAAPATKETESRVKE